MTLLIDLSGHDAPEVGAVADAWITLAEQWDMAVLVLVREQGRLAEELSESGCTLLPVRTPQAFEANWSAALQAVTTDHVVLINGPADPYLGWHAPHAAAVQLFSSAFPWCDCRGIAFQRADYVRVRGFHSRLPGPAAAMDNLVERITSLHGARLSAPTRLMANLPTWPRRPVGMSTSVSVLIVAADGSRCDESVLSAQAQSVDDIDIHVADLTGHAMPQAWIEEHAEPPPLRFDSRGAVTRHDVSGGAEAWSAVIEALAGDYTLILGGDDIAAPWAAEVALRHAEPHRGMVRGPRAPFSSDGTIGAGRHPEHPEVLLVETQVLRSWQPCAVEDVHRLVSDLTATVGRSPGTATVFAFAPGTVAPDAEATWRSPWSRGALESGRALLPDSFGERAVVLRQLCVIKVDELQAYDRIDLLVAELDVDGKLVHESCVLRGGQWRDFARLARAGYGFEALLGSGAAAGRAEYERARERRAVAGQGGVVVSGSRRDLYGADHG